MSGSEADFSSEVELSIVVPDSEVRGARDTIESGIGSVPIRPDGGRGGAGGRSLRPRFLRQNLQGQRDNLAEIAEQGQRRNMLVSELLEQSNLSRGGGGGGGGGGGSDPLGDIINNATDSLFEGLGLAASATALSGAATALGSSATALTGSAGALTGAAGALAAADLLSNDSVDVNKPDWVPLPVDEPAPIPVEDVGPVSIQVNATGGPARPAPVMTPSNQPSQDTGPSREEVKNAFDNDGGLLRTLLSPHAIFSPNFGTKTLPTPESIERMQENQTGSRSSRDLTSPFTPGERGRQPRRGMDSGGTDVVVYNETTVESGVSEREVSQIVERELDNFERRLERELSRGARGG